VKKNYASWGKMGGILTFLQRKHGSVRKITKTDSNEAFTVIHSFIHVHQQKSDYLPHQTLLTL